MNDQALENPVENISYMWPHVQLPTRARHINQISHEIFPLSHCDQAVGESIQQPPMSNSEQDKKQSFLSLPLPAIYVERIALLTSKHDQANMWATAARGDKRKHSPLVDVICLPLMK